MAEPSRVFKTESRKSYRCGFAITESEIRRLHDVLVQQMNRTAVGDGFLTSYEIKYRNGSVSQPTSLDQILLEENFGSGAIVRLSIDVSDKTEKPSNAIGVSFTNTEEEDNPFLSPILYKVSGTDRDWVFVTSSQLDERVSKIRQFSPLQFFSRKSRIFPGSFISMLAAFFAILTMLLAMTRHDHRAVEQVDQLEQSWKAGTLKDGTEVALQLARITLSRSNFSGSELGWIAVITIAIPLLVGGIGGAFLYFQPSYNFLWGDYVERYEKRRSRGKFLLVGVALTVVLGLFVNFISKKIGF